MQIRENARGFYINVTHGTSQRSSTNNRHPLAAAAAIKGSTSFSCFPLSFRAWPGIQVAKESMLTWTPARRPEWQIKKQAGVTGRGKTLCCDRKRKNAAWDRKELIRRSLDVFLRKQGITLWVDSCSAIEGWQKERETPVEDDGAQGYGV